MATDDDAAESALEKRARELGAPTGYVRGWRTSPMLCSSTRLSLDEHGYVYELKLDGVRIIADRRGDETWLTYRSGRRATQAYPEIVDAIAELACQRVVLDGEVVAIGADGFPDFQLLAQRIHVMREHDARWLAKSVPVVYLVFDMLQIGNRDLRRLPLLDRKRLLQQLLARQDGQLLQYVEHFDSGAGLFELCDEHDIEGVVAKRGRSAYRAGPHRGDDWVKIKREREGDFVVIGWTEGSGDRADLGALELATYEDGELMTRGRAGSGISSESAALLLKILRPLEIDSCPAKGPLKAGKVRHFTAPELVVSVRYGGWSNDGRLRFPVFRGLRSDISPADCDARPARPGSACAAPSKAPAAGDRVRLTNQGKLFWPDAGLTKGDLCRYYDAVAPTLLPYLQDRPVIMVRHPDGIGGKSFYQWNLPRDAPRWIRTYRYREEHDSGARNLDLVVVDDVDTLLYVANLGVIPLMMMAGRIATIDCCDYATIDFDAAPDQLPQVIELMLGLRDLLDDVGLPSYPKTSGQSGMHVLIPLGPDVSSESTRMFAELVAGLLASRFPAIGTVERSVRARTNKVYIDTLPNGAGRTVVAPYSARAYPGATVSTPLFWDEIGPALDPRELTIVSVPRRVADLGDPMEGLLGETPGLRSAIGELAALAGMA